MLIPAGHYSGDRKNTCCMPRRKRTAFEGRNSAGEERIVKRSARGDVARPLSSRNRLHGQVDDRAVSVSLAGQQSCIYLIPIMPSIARNQQRNGYTDNFRCGYRGGEYVVDVVKVPGVSLKVRHGMRIRHQKSCGAANNGKSRQPMLPSPQLHRKQPNCLLIVKKVLRQRSPRHSPVRSRVVAMLVERGRRRAVRQPGLVVLGEGRMRQGAQAGAENDHK